MQVTVTSTGLGVTSTGLSEDMTSHASNCTSTGLGEDRTSHAGNCYFYRPG